MQRDLFEKTALHQHAKIEVGVRAGRFTNVAPLGCESCPLVVIALLALIVGLNLRLLPSW